jgi:curved DNA-binding protein CbpA
MRVPRPKSGVDIKSLPLSPAEAFLFSRIDAATSEKDLAMITGLSPADVAAALDRLALLGAIEGIAPASPTPPPAPARSDPPSNARAVIGTASGSSPPLYDPAELDEVVEIDAEKKRRILDLFYRLDDLTYYEVLDVEAQADKKRIKSAYYAMAPEFHPDRFFRKNLGSYKAKIEAVFNRVTIAHDVLTAKDRRAEYDDYLAQTQTNRAMAAIIEQTPRDVARIQAAVDVADAATGRGSPGRYASEPAPPPPVSEPPAASAPPSVEPAPLSAEAAKSRRETLARKLSGTMRRPTPPPVVEPDLAAQQRAADALIAHHEARVDDARRAQLQRHLDQGKASLAQKQFAAAANAYRIAASLAPHDRAVQITCAEAMRLADAALADGYLKQAHYEESLDRWGEAALSYSKVCNGRPGDASAHERVAFTTLKSSANVRRAVEFARRAVELDPRSPQFRVTLASAYQAAGLEKSALGEIERALELAPGDQKIKELGQQIRVQAQKPAN